MPDVVVLGGGSTGEHFCGALRRLDPDVEITLVEGRLVGGECSYYACMPSKTLLRAPEVQHAASRTPGVAASALDTKAIFAWRDWMTSDWDDAGQVKWLDSQHIALVRGEGRVVRPGIVEVGGEEIAYDRLVVATGSSAVRVEGLEDAWTTNDATSSHEVPEGLIVVGGGVAGCELAQLYRRLGSEVTIVNRGDRLLPRIDADAADVLRAAFEEEGIELVFGADVRTESSARLKPGTRILTAVGRRPNAEGLGLEQLGVEVAKRGIAVDDGLRAAENVWAIGDCTGVAQFTHVGKYQARVAAQNVAGGSAKADYRAIPAVAFTDPQIATVGTMEGVTASYDVESLPRASTYEKPSRHGFLKVAADQERRVLVGAVAVGPEAGEWCQQLTLAIRAEVAVETLLDVIQPYPTFSEAVFYAVQELELNIVVASDRSDTASRAVSWAAEMARRYEAQLVVVQAFVPGPPPPGAETDLAVYAEETCGTGVKVRVTAGEDPATAIVAAAEAEKADVLVVGNIGMSGRREFLLGNVPNRVSHNARCTVVIVNTADEPKKRWRRG